MSEKLISCGLILRRALLPRLYEGLTPRDCSEAYWFYGLRRRSVDLYPGEVVHTWALEAYNDRGVSHSEIPVIQLDQARDNTDWDKLAPDVSGNLGELKYMGKCFEGLDDRDPDNEVVHLKLEVAKTRWLSTGRRLRVAEVSTYGDTWRDLASCLQPGPWWQERIAAAAIKHLESGVLYVMPPPARHHTIQQNLTRASAVTQGFITSTGRFVSREEAMGIAQQAGQLLPGPRRGTMRELYTEDLWQG